ncbi:MAG: hypothetical protein AAF702_00500 [Chloroflexota bacterium]
MFAIHAGKLFDGVSDTLTSDMIVLPMESALRKSVLHRTCRFL